MVLELRAGDEPALVLAQDENRVRVELSTVKAAVAALTDAAADLMGTMDLRYLLGALARIAFSLLCAGVFYFAWMAAFLLATRSQSPALEAFLWLLAPVITAAGFTVGIIIPERIIRPRRGRFLRTFLWPLIGCAIGAGIIYSFGPMLIVFGMFAVGTMSVALREVIILFERAQA